MTKSDDAHAKPMKMGAVDPSTLDALSGEVEINFGSDGFPLELQRLAKSKGVTPADTDSGTLESGQSSPLSDG